MTLTDETRLAQSDTALASVIDEQAVIMDIDSGYFFQMNGVGSAIWWALTSPAKVSEICRAVQGEFDVDPATCREEVVDFAEMLLARGLLKPA